VLSPRRALVAGLLSLNLAGVGTGCADPAAPPAADSGVIPDAQRPVVLTCMSDEAPGGPGTTCVRVGASECTGGISAGPDWKCVTVGPPATCAAGWATTKDGWCEPVLPAAACPAGSREVIGKTECQPVGDCGTAPFGELQDQPGTLHVDAAWSGASSDGTSAAPYKTIADALAAAPASGWITLALAAGEYKEDVYVEKRQLRLVGRCPAKVRISGAASGGNSYGVIEALNGELDLRSLTVTGPKNAVVLRGGKGTIARLVVDGGEGYGVAAARASGLTVQDSLIVGNREIGISLEGTTATVERTTIRDLRAAAAGLQWTHAAISAGVAPTTKQPSTLTVRESVISGALGAAVLVNGSAATVEGCALQQTGATPAQENGSGVLALGAATVTVRDTLIAESRTAGVAVLSATATLERLVIRDTKERLTDQRGGHGVYAMPDEGTGPSSTVTLSESVLARNTSGGVGVISSKATVERCLIKDTLPTVLDQGAGIGVGAVMVKGAPAPSLTLRDSLITGNRTIGVLLTSAEGTIERCVIKDTQAQASDQKWGRGVEATIDPGLDAAPKLTMRDSLVVGNRENGVGVYSGDATLERCAIRDTRAAASELAQGAGVLAAVVEGMTRASALTVRQCVVSGCQGSGIRVSASAATVERCAVRDTRPTDPGVGDGIAVSEEGSTIALSGSLIDHSARAGLLCSRAGGLVQSTVFHSGVFAIDLEDGATPAIKDDNIFFENGRNSVSSGAELTPAPVPPVPKIQL